MCLGIRVVFDHPCIQLKESHAYREGEQTHLHIVMNKSKLLSVLITLRFLQHLTGYL